MKTKLLYINFLLFIFCSLSNAQENSTQVEINDFDFLIGTWEADFGKFKYYEEWEKGNDKLTGTGYRIKEDKRLDGEKLILMNIHGYISYIATVGKQQPVLFALVKNSDNNYVFENKEHDFPQRIIYQFINKDSVKVFVEGEMKGEFVKDEYNMTHVAEEKTLLIK